MAVFMESGYSAASMDAVAARAGVSKATIYVHFDSKRALFEAIIRNRAEMVFGSLSLVEGAGDAREILTGLAKNFIGLILNKDALAMYRVVLAESHHQPDVGDAFYQAGPAYARQQVSSFFRDLDRRGTLQLRGRDPDILADLFLSMLSGDLQMGALFGRPKPQHFVDALVTTAVDLVLESRLGRD